ncbi:hypothetical protein BIU82_04900 [Arthrobacter sp. SW1]|nr:hypothetical protein BIU82_04900 [Arthrobacter sp. SW1]
MEPPRRVKTVPKTGKTPGKTVPEWVLAMIGGVFIRRSAGVQRAVADRADAGRNTVAGTDAGH